jgi:dienelactone hydrolase
MKCFFALIFSIVLLGMSQIAFGEITPRVVDIPTRSGVTQRFLYLQPENPQASVIMLAGGHGGLQISESGVLGWGAGNFLVRMRQQFAEKRLATVVIDAPSDRQTESYLGGFRQTPEHVADVKAVIAWLKQQNNLPVWLVGTSRGTQSAAYVATQLEVKDGGPDGLILTSTILSDSKSRSVPEMQVERIRIPVLVVHHKEDGCKHCNYDDVPVLMKKITAAPRKELLAFDGGKSQGDPCQAMAYHGFNGIEQEVVTQISEWIVKK